MATTLYHKNPEAIVPWLTPELQAEMTAFANEPDLVNPALPLAAKCGIVVRNDDGTVAFVRSPNTHENPAYAFRLLPSAWARNKQQAIAIWHSHTPAEYPPLSLEDIAQAHSIGIPYLCYHVEGAWDYYSPNTPNPFPLEVRDGQDDPSQLSYYVGWRWVWGRCDCSHLIYHYYMGIYGIKLQLPPPDATARAMFANGWNRFREALDENNFRELDVDEDLQIGDIVVICKDGPNPHHGAIVVDVDDSDIPLLLHIDRDILSRVEQYDFNLQQKTDSIWRHPQLDESEQFIADGG